MAATVSLVFTLCWIPALTSLCVLSFSNPSQKQGHILQVMSTVLVISNCSANPFIYVLVSHRFRRHFMELVCCAGVSNTKVYPAPRGKRASSRLPPVQIQLVSLADCQKLSSAVEAPGLTCSSSKSCLGGRRWISNLELLHKSQLCLLPKSQQ